jgi:hypothetical protein
MLFPLSIKESSNDDEGKKQKTKVMTEFQIAEDRDKMYCEIFTKILSDFYRTF